MAQPAWIETLRERFLADEGNFFVVTGAGTPDVEALLGFLADKRDLIGVVGASGVTFPVPGHEVTFQRTLDAAATLTGTRHLPDDTLARIRVALGAAATSQAWVLRDLEGVRPEAIRGWPAALRSTNHLVVCLADPVPSWLAPIAIAIDARPPPEPVPPIPATDTPDRLDRMQIAFALRTARQIAEADGVLHLEELDLLVRIFPDPVLRNAGFLAPGGDLTPEAEAAYADSLVELATQLPQERKLALIELFREACVVDGHLHPREEATLRRAARTLGLSPTEVDRLFA